ncbi:MAG: DUF1007 family protein [Methylobacteriaceae bacterium]|nr:DUF1007 family protein [Methylobacteriaceae bacterium]
MRRTSVPELVAAIFLFLASTLAASAHPHVWVVVKSEVLFGPDGKITGIRHAWTFDEMYSAFATQGLGTNGKPPTPEELQPLAKVNVESLAEFDFFTYPKHGSEKPEFAAPIDYSLEADANKVITLHFTLPLKTPVDAKKPFSFQVYDPTYFVSFAFEKGAAAKLVGAPPGCSMSTLDPNPLVAADTQKLSEAYFSNMSPGSDFGIKLASRVVVACP